MRFDTVLTVQIDWPCFKIRFHSPETIFNLPSSFADFQYICNVIIQKVCTDGVKPVILFFFSNLIQIEIVVDFRFLAFFSRSDFIYKSCRVIRVFALLFQSAIGNHLFCPGDLFRTYRLLIGSILWGICDD